MMILKDVFHEVLKVIKGSLGNDFENLIGFIKD